MGALVLWLWLETHALKVVSSNPVASDWMDLFAVKLCRFLNRLKISENEAKDG